jgi:hypothetical protein
MAFDGSGTFSRLYNFTQDRNDGIKILAARVDSEFDGVATGLSSTFLRDGTVAMAGALPMGLNKITGIGNGTVGAPALAFGNAATTGIYLTGTSTVGFAVGGAQKLEVHATGITVTGGVTINGQVLDGLTAGGVAIAELTGVEDTLPYYTSASAAATTSLTASGRTVIGAAGVTGTGNVVFSASPTLTGNVVMGNAASTHTISGQISNSASANGDTLTLLATHASFTGAVIKGQANRAGNVAYFLLALGSNAAVSADAEFLVTGAGTVSSDGGTAMSSPADYAEMFEWADGNPNNEDRAGWVVCFDQPWEELPDLEEYVQSQVSACPYEQPNYAQMMSQLVQTLQIRVVDNVWYKRPFSSKIRRATWEDDRQFILGAYSGNPAVLGDSGMMRWSEKYLRDEWNRPLYEDYEWVEWTCGRGSKKRTVSYNLDLVPDDVKIPKNAVYGTSTRRVLNPEYDPSHDYVGRDKRPEWDAIGLLGKLRIRSGQPVGLNWLKMREINERVDEYLVR